MKTEKIKETLLEEEMKKSYLSYALSVIIGRALPDVRDGLKPVHRRILYSMYEEGLLSNKPFRKSARIVGNCLGKYHPHGDAAVYDALVRLAQDFNMRYPLIEGQGNFGSIDGDSAAAMRYTEARLNKLGEEMLKDIDKNAVSFQPNFDGSLKEPVVLPSRIPNLLINGASGIAVGMATNIPPHNIKEVADAIIAILDDEHADIFSIIKGPDFPTGALIQEKGIRELYENGRGKIIVRARTHFEEISGRKSIVITEIPYAINKSLLIEEIASLVKEGKIEGIYDIRDESDKEGIRIVIELLKDANAEFILNKLFAHTKLQTTYWLSFLAIQDSVPRIFSLRQLIKAFIDHRIKVIRRIKEYELKKASDKLHINEGILIAIENIDAVIQLIKDSRNIQDAKESLINKYNLTEKQANAILDLKLQRLTSLEKEKIIKEIDELKKNIAELKEILASEEKIKGIIKDEMKEIKEKYADERRSEIVKEEFVVEEERLIEDKEVIIILTKDGYIKRMPLDLYREQKRGGKGVRAFTTKEEDFIEDIIFCNSKQDILFFTDKGRVFIKKAYEIPEASRNARGKAIVNFLKLKDESITRILPFEKKYKFLFFITKKGFAKRTNIKEFENLRQSGIIALKLIDDSLVDVIQTSGNDKIIIATYKGRAIKFNENNIPILHRNARGVKAIKLEDDFVIGSVKDDGTTLLTVTEKGFGKRTKLDEYPLIKRGGKGVINIKIKEKNGFVAAIETLNDEDEVFLITKNGMSIMLSAKEIPIIGRNTLGVRLIKLQENDKLVALTKIK